jgi:hypothetical protein
MTRVRLKMIEKENQPWETWTEPQVITFFVRMVLMMFSDATMANLQDDSPDLHIADAPRARAIGIRASARIIAPRGRSQDPGFFQLQAFVRH